MKQHPIALEFLDLINQIRTLHAVKRPPLKRFEIPKQSILQTLLTKSYHKLFGLQKIIITGLPRTGTSYLANSFSCFTNAKVFGEILDSTQGKGFANNVEAVEKIASMQRKSLVGLKYLLFQGPNFFNDLLELQQMGWRIFGTKRNDIFNQVLSYYLATALNFYHRNAHEKGQHAPIYINPDLFEKTLTLFKKSTLLQGEYYEQLGKGITIIDFEKTGDFDFISNLICSELNLWKIDKEPKETKTQENNPLLVLNWDEIKALKPA